ncbi:MAG: PQQ-dependent sugar dehydrogenase [Actinobacteria bacterium]|nr:PQQ-dependent sugar dehydrogenase [Actinomycetota bacterium]
MLGAVVARPPAVLAAFVALFAALGACGSAPAGSHDVTTAPHGARAAAFGAKLTRIGTFAAPTYLTQAPGDARRLFVVEQAGRIRVVRDGRVLRAPFLDIRSKVVSGGEQGLLGLAFAPDYARSGRFYVDYTDVNGDTRIVEYRRGASRDRASPRSARQLLFQDQPEDNHNGGQLAFGPDGLLYIGLGDGGGGDDQHGRIGNGQSLGTLLGKILRIDPRPRGRRPYRIPRGNPFVGRRDARPAIYAWGLRNPWRFSFDRATGDMAIGDVGQDHVEEVDFRRRGTARGVNFGWRAFEGTRVEDPSLHIRGDVKPVLEYTHDHGCSVTGGYVIRDPRLPALDGRYVYGDYCQGDLLTAKLRQNGASERRPLDLHVDALSSFGEDDAGHVYVVSLNGPVYRLDPR